MPRRGGVDPLPQRSFRAYGGCLLRLVASKDGLPDGLEDEIPSIFLKEMSPELLAQKYGSFGVLNRPYTVVKLVNSPELMARFHEDYIFIAETDHVLFQDIPNLATETMPAGYKFGYMQPNQGFDRLIKRVWPQVRTPSVWGLSHSRRNATATCLCGRCGVAAPAVACCPSSVCELSAVTSEGRA